MKLIQRSWIIILCFYLSLGCALAQTNFFSIEVTQEGVYKLAQNEISKLGISDISQVAIFGYPGMLPQKVDSAQLKFQEIPSYLENNELYFFLSGPDSRTLLEGDWQLDTHLYTDTLRYLVGVKTNPKRILSESLENTNSNASSTFYAYVNFHEEKINLLNSGRIWYSNPIPSGGNQRVDLFAQSSSNLPWKIEGRWMSQSLAISDISLLVDGEIIVEDTFSAIPNSIYGIKGREKYFKEYFETNDNEVTSIELNFTGSASNSLGYKQYISLGIPSESLNPTPGIWYLESGTNSTLAKSGETMLWDISDFYTPKNLNFEEKAIVEGNKIAVFNSGDILGLELKKEINTTLRSQSYSSDLLILTPSSLESSANRLAAHKLGRGIATDVVVLEDIYGAYSYGNKDLNGIRNFIADYYHKGNTLNNVLILGKGTFDNKQILGGRPNLFPIYSSRESLNPLSTFSSDDYFGLIDWGQGVWEESRTGDELMQIGIGRLPVINLTEANIVVDKIIAYENNPSKGDWKRTITFFADDADNNIHLRDSEAHSNYLFENHRTYFQDKLYLDRFPQENLGTSQQSPQAKSALEETLNRGTLFLNYIGHGNETTLTAEEVFRIEDIANWPEQEQLALWITATCEFGRHDSPFIRSAAEELLIAEGKGAIGLLATGRPVFSSVNFQLNEAFISEVFEKENEVSLDLGTIFRNTKNGSLNGALNRNFSLLGDPSMRLADPELSIRVTELKNTSTENLTDTLSAFREILLIAEVIEPLTGAIQTNFDGKYLLDLRDKPITSKTLGNESNPVEFKEEKILLFRGEGEIKQGKLEAIFFIPGNINYEFGKGSLRILGTDKISGQEAIGGLAPLIGGSDIRPNDVEGPIISPLFGNQEGPELVFPSTRVTLKLVLEDPSGINVSGINPGQEIQIQINNNEPIVLNSLFLAENGSFIRGKLDFQIDELQEGKNQIIIKVWDNLGNGSIFEKFLTVEGSNQIQILSKKVYPNPASKEANFEFTHNRPGDNLLVDLSVYDMNGKILFVESKRLVEVEEKISDLQWIFLQNQSKYPAKGTYIYKLTLQSERDNSLATSSGKIIIE